MATNIPPHNLGELAEAVFWALDNYDADEEATLAAVMERVKGPDFPTSGLIVGSQGIADAYKTGRGSIRMRGVVEVRRRLTRAYLDCHHRVALSGQPRQLHHDRLPSRSATAGSPASPTSRTNPATASACASSSIKRDAVAKVVLNNLYKHTQLQTSFGANMLQLSMGCRARCASIR